MKHKCPICQGKGILELPAIDHRNYKLEKRKMAKILLDNGYSIRQVTKFCSYGSTRTVFKIKHND